MTHNLLEQKHISVHDQGGKTSQAPPGVGWKNSNQWHLKLEQLYKSRVEGNPDIELGAVTI